MRWPVVCWWWPDTGRGMETEAEAEQEAELEAESEGGSVSGGAVMRLPR